MGFIDGIIIGGIDAYRNAKDKAKQQANFHLQEMSDKIDMIERVCKYSSCYNCRYGTSPEACEKTALIEMFNEALDYYASKGLVRKG